MIVVAVLALGAFSVDAGPTKFRKSSKPAPGMYIVALEETGEPIDRVIENLARSHGGKVTNILRGAPWQGYTVSGLPEAAAVALSHDPRVKVVEEDTLAIPLEVAPPAHANWGLDRTNQYYLPLDNAGGAGCMSSSSVYAYVMDTGINDPNGTQFGARLIHGYKDPALANYADEYAWDPATSSYWGHGTSVASIVGGATYGAAGSVNIVNVKVTNGSSGGAGAAAAGIRWINTHNSNGGPKIVNMSLHYAPPATTGDASSLLEQDLFYSRDVYNITYVVGAGNDYGTTNGRDACLSGTPGRLGREPNTLAKDNGIITVGATYIRPSDYMLDRRSVHPDGDGFYGRWASDYGACVDIFAPGTRVPAMRGNGNAMEFSGTSAATPYVTGAAVRRLAYHYSVNYGAILPPAQVEAAVKADSTSGVIDSSTIGASSPNLLLRRANIGKCRSV